MHFSDLQRLKNYENRCADAISKIHAVNAFNQLAYTINAERIINLNKSKSKGIDFVLEVLGILDRRVMDKLVEESADFCEGISDNIFDIHLHKLSLLFSDSKNENIESIGFAIDASERSSELRQEIRKGCAGKYIDLLVKVEKLLSFKEQLSSSFNRYRAALSDDQEHDYNYMLNVFAHSVRGDLVSAGLEILSKSIDVFKQANTDVQFIKKYQDAFLNYAWELNQLTSELVIVSGTIRSYIKSTMALLNLQKMENVINSVESEGGSAANYLINTIADRSIEDLENDRRVVLANELNL